MIFRRWGDPGRRAARRKRGARVPLGGRGNITISARVVGRMTTTGSRPEVLRYTAFSGDPAGGNPAGVVLDASALDDGEMLAVAAQLGYSSPPS